MTMGYKLTDTRLSSYGFPLIPILYKLRVPMSRKAAETVYQTRLKIQEVLRGDPRKIVYLGPCSVDNVEAFKAYVREIQPYARMFRDKLIIVVRAHTEKPRSRYAWPGFIIDSELSGVENYWKGYVGTRKLLKFSNEIGLPAGMEFVNEDTPQIVGEFLAMAAIGARSVEDQEHRAMASGLSMPVGMKNNTGGNIERAIDAVLYANHPSSFRALSPWGFKRPVQTLGNDNVFVFLRGGYYTGPNYNFENVKRAQRLLEKEGLRPNVLIDCSHDNTMDPDNDNKKNFERQLIVAEDVLGQIVDGNDGIIGLSLESYILPGSSPLPKNLGDPDVNPHDAPFGTSRTDPCIGLEDTIKFLEKMNISIRG